MDSSPCLVWFRQDLRLSDNPAFIAACERGGPVIPLYIWAPQEEGDWPPGEASRWWLHYSLKSLQESLKGRGSHLILLKGPSAQNLLSLVRETGAGAVFWNRRYEPYALQRDAQVESALKDSGIECESFNSALLFEPWEMRTKGGGPYQVFTPFWKACLASWPPPPDPEPAPKKIPSPRIWPKGVLLESLLLEPKLDWKEGLAQAWVPGESAAKEILKRFLRKGVRTYKDDRNRPDLVGTSRLSPYLHFGEIGPRQIWRTLRATLENERDRQIHESARVFLSEIGWREFAHHLLYHFPRTPTEPLREIFNDLPWRRNAKKQALWEKGKTGYPIVDAAMRELWATGWMHNRARMIVASFLTKDLMIPWQEGAKWFWDTLADADLANNTLGWQWTAGCGADAAPFFRVFNPVGQSEKFDPEGAYIRKWVPELSRTPKEFIHRPWEDGAAGLFGKGQDYPPQMVDHAAARDKALAAFEQLRRR